MKYLLLLPLIACLPACTVASGNGSQWQYASVGGDVKKIGSWGMEGVNNSKSAIVGIKTVGTLGATSMVTSAYTKGQEIVAGNETKRILAKETTKRSATEAVETTKRAQIALDAAKAEEAAAASSLVLPATPATP
jgi:hypothetical protein